MEINQFTVHNGTVINCGIILGDNSSNREKIFTPEK